MIMLIAKCFNVDDAFQLPTYDCDEKLTCNYLYVDDLCFSKNIKESIKTTTIG